MYLRIYFGPDYTDESFYLGCAQRFTLGDIPFVDENNIAQGIGVILAPALSLYKAITGGTEGVVLYFRHLYFLFTLGIGLALFTVLTRHVIPPLALTAALLYVVCPPINLPDLSYYAVGGGAFCVGVIAVFLSNPERTAPRQMMIAGMAHAISLLAFPPLAALAVVYLPWIGWQSPRKWPRWAVYALAGTFTTVLWLAAYGSHPLNVWSVLVATRKSTVIYAERGPGALVASFFTLGLQLIRPATLALILPVLVARQIRPRVPRLSLFIVWAGVSAMCVFSHKDQGSATLTLALAWAAPVLAFPFKDLNWVRPLFLRLWLPSLLITGFMYWASASGYPSSAIGALPAAIIGMVFLGKQLEIFALDLPVPSAPYFVLGSILLAALYFTHTAYREGDVREMTARIARGPFRGMMARPVRQQYVEALDAEIKQLSDRRAPILIYPLFITGYLGTERPAVAKSMWNTCLNLTSEECVDFIAQRSKGASVVRIDRMPYNEDKITPATPELFPWDAWIKSNCRVVGAKDFFELLECP
jgi:hypothetical protein